MSMIDKIKGSGSVSRIGEGSYSASIVKVVDIGTQDDEWTGEMNRSDKRWITFKIQTETITVLRRRWRGRRNPTSLFYWVVV